jgi:hypothetical protein
MQNGTLIPAKVSTCVIVLGDNQLFKRKDVTTMNMENKQILKCILFSDEAKITSCSFTADIN